MADSRGTSPQRLVWLEGVRIFAAIVILLYHAQLLFTNYAFTPQPTGLAVNLGAIGGANARLGGWGILFTPFWFGFQFVDVFVLLGGFSLVLSLRGKPLEIGRFLCRRALRILLPFWTVAWLSYPVLWAIGIATHTYKPDPWHVFAGATFPLLFDYAGDLLLLTSGPWWFLPLILSLSLVFPLLWHLLERWGSQNLLLVTLAITLGYRALAVYAFAGHPTYVAIDTSAAWLPFLPFVSKLSTFVLGMIVARSFLQGKGVVFWHPSIALLVGVLIYSLGFVCQFYRSGWIVAELLLPIGLTLCCMVVFRALATLRRFVAPMLWLGSHSYSYFLLHNFVVDRTLNLVVHDDRLLYWVLLPVMAIVTLVLAVLADAMAPLIQRFFLAMFRDLDYVLTIDLPQRRRIWQPQVGDRVCYKGDGWTVVKVEALLDDKECYLCQISDGRRTMWLSEDDLELEHNPPPEKSGNSKLNSARP